ncbi:major head protein [Burkholderia phage Bm1]
MAISKVHSSLRAKAVRPLVLTQDQVSSQAVSALRKMGITIDAADVRQQVNALFTGDSTGFGTMATSPSIPTPLQFLQTWLPGFVEIITAARKIDKLVGIQTVGSWEDEEIVQGVIENQGFATQYGDTTNVPLASWNTNFERRTVVRGELGLLVGVLEEKRAAAMRVSSAEEKRRSVGISLEIFRNAIGFNGWHNGTSRTFGFLNDPSLPAYQEVAPGAGAGNPTTWDKKTFLEITADLRVAFAKLRTQSKDQIDPREVETTLALPTNKTDFLSVTSDFGISVADWLEQTYKKCRVESAPELMGANGGEDVFYLYADSVSSSVDGSTDDGATFAQLIQNKFMTLGVEKRSKSYIEDYSNATAGILLKRPYAVVRYSGI